MVQPPVGLTQRVYLTPQRRHSGPNQRVLPEYINIREKRQGKTGSPGISAADAHLRLLSADRPPKRRFPASSFSARARKGMRLIAHLYGARSSCWAVRCGGWFRGPVGTSGASLHLLNIGEGTRADPRELKTTCRIPTRWVHFGASAVRAKRGGLPFSFCPRGRCQGFGGGRGVPRIRDAFPDACVRPAGRS